MATRTSLLRVAVGKKAIMAATGLVLFGFVLGHLAGNLKLYQGSYVSGPHAGERVIDVYAEGLRELGAPLFGYSQVIWIARITLLVAVGLHLWAAISLTRQNRAARPIGYAQSEALQSTYAARTMRWGGVVLLLFVLYHLADLTFGWANPQFHPGRVYDNLVASLERPVVAGLYVGANLALGLHLFHGLWSLFQSLGWSSPRWNPWRRRFATAAALIVTAGNLSFPVAVLTGLVR